MSVRKVKNSMNKLNMLTSKTLNSLNNLINMLSWGTVNTNDLITRHANRLANNLSVLERDIEHLYSMTSEELHIFFRNYNSLLSKTIVEIGDIETKLDKLISDSEVEPSIEVLISDRVVNGTLLLQVFFIGVDLKPYIPQLVRFKATLIKLQSETTNNNNNLIIKNNRG